MNVLFFNPRAAGAVTLILVDLVRDVTLICCSVLVLPHADASVAVFITSTAIILEGAHRTVLRSTVATHSIIVLHFLLTFWCSIHYSCFVSFVIRGGRKKEEEGGR